MLCKMKKLAIANIMKEDWDYLIVLDACRYDYFAAMWKKYFEGILEKRISLGSCTLEWCLESFKDYYPDVVYISANPYINSKIEIDGFDAKKHFYKIVDVWDFGWNRELGTVLPETVNKVAQSLVRKFPQKRFIIHYLQPHAPYISLTFRSVGFPNPKMRHNRVLTGIQNQYDKEYFEKLIKIAKFFIKANIAKAYARTLLWKIRELLGLPPHTPMDDIRRKYGVKGLRKAYSENLKIVLSQVARLCNGLLRCDFHKQIVITSDHGELLGERCKYGHGIRDSRVLEIPWLKIKNVKVRNTLEKDITSTEVYSINIDKENYRSKLKMKIKNLKSRGRI